ncbi:hypothetical protein RV02_GL002308 [Enterococcus gilvus]|nr:hypothetical protein RV02_GL002308 [Enterococcus gilvus]
MGKSAKGKKKLKTTARYRTSSILLEKVNKKKSDLFCKPTK